MDKLKSMSDIEAARKKQTPTKAQEITPVKTSNPKETFKTIVITVLVTGIIAFIGGNIYANQLHTDKTNAVNTASAQVLKDSTPQK